MKATITYYDAAGGEMRSDSLDIPKQPLPGDILEHAADRIRWATDSIDPAWSRFELIIEKEG